MGLREFSVEISSGEVTEICPKNFIFCPKNKFKPSKKSIEALLRHIEALLSRTKFYGKCPLPAFKRA